MAPLNPWEDLEDRVGPVDRPHRVTLATVAELPFGQGRAIGNDWGGVTNALLGGWQLSGKFEWQTGQPLTWGNVYYDPGCGDPSDLTSHWGTRQRPEARHRRAVLRHVVLLHAQRAAVPQRRRPAEHVRRAGDLARRRQHPHVPDARCRTSASRTITCWIWA